jgi:hypothetical protein
MSQPVHGYLRFCFDLSERANRNVKVSPQVTGNACQSGTTRIMLDFNWRPHFRGRLQIDDMAS